MINSIDPEPCSLNQRAVSVPLKNDQLLQEVFSFSNNCIAHRKSMPPLKRKKTVKSTLSLRLSLPISLTETFSQSILNTNNEISPRQEIQEIYKKLYLICEIKWGTDPQAKMIIAFVDELCFLNKFSSSDGSIDPKTVLKIISQIIFLVNTQSSLVLELANKKNVPNSIKKINQAFRQSLIKIHKKIIDTCIEQLNKGFKNAERLKNIAIPIAISRILIPQSGVILDALIPGIIKEFVQVQNPYTQSLKAGLELIKRSDEVRKKIESVKAPEDQNSKQALLIRATLNLPLGLEIQDTHAKRTVFSALLTHLRQGQNGSCFASFIAIELQSINPTSALDDFQELIAKGKLSRTLDGCAYEFPYLIKIENQELHEKASLDHPGIRSVFKFLGIPDFSPPLGTNNELLEALSFVTNSDPDHLRIIFNAATHHPLLSAWENSIAGMAEGMKGGMLKSALIQSVLYIAKIAAKKIEMKDLNILIELEKSILNYSQYLYDPTHSVNNVYKSAFLLYDSRETQDGICTEWKKIDSVSSFQAYVSSLVEEIYMKFPTAGTLQFKSAIIEELSSEQTIIALLKRYHSENQSLQINSESISNLKYTPWAASTGNDPHMVLKMYHQTSSSFKIKQITPATAEELFFLIQQTMHDLPFEKKLKYLKHGDYVIPIRIRGVHVFSLLTCHPTMQPFLQTTNMITVTSVLIEASRHMRSGLIAFASSFISKIQIDTIPKKSTLPNLRDCLVELIWASQLRPNQRKEIEHQIDIKIIECLSKEKRASWEQSIIHIADTNWQTGIHDIHYGIGMNPGTGKVELLSLLDNGKIYKFLNQDLFLKGQTWELYIES